MAYFLCEFWYANFFNSAQKIILKRISSWKTVTFLLLLHTQFLSDFFYWNWIWWTTRLTVTGPKLLSTMYRRPESYTRWNMVDKFCEWLRNIFMYRKRHLLKSWRAKRTAVGMLKSHRHRTFLPHPRSRVILWWTSMISLFSTHPVLLASPRSTEFLKRTLSTSRGYKPSNRLFWSSICFLNQSTIDSSIFSSSPNVNSRSPGLSTGSICTNSLAKFRSFLHLSVINWAWYIMIFLVM